MKPSGVGLLRPLGSRYRGHKPLGVAPLRSPYPLMTLQIYDLFDYVPNFFEIFFVVPQIFNTKSENNYIHEIKVLFCLFWF